MNKINLVGFDNDGVLSDTILCVYETDSSLIEKYSGLKPSLQDWRSAFQNVVEWDVFYTSFGVPNDNLKQITEEFYAVHRNVPLRMGGVNTFLDGVLQKKFVVTLNPNREEVLSNFRSMGFMNYFTEENIFTTKKGKSEHILEACDFYGVLPKNTCFIGDSPSDISEGKKAGVTTIALSASTSFASEDVLRRAKPDYLLHNYNQILKVLKWLS